MKSLHLFFCCTLMVLFSFQSCSNGTPDVTKAAETVKAKVEKTMTDAKNDPPDSVPLEEARGWAVSWQKSFVPTVNVQGWEMPASDLRHILDETHHAARFYIGQIDSTGEFKLVVVGVDSLGNDMLDSTATPPQLVYDVSTPCPTACGAFLDGE